MARWETAPESNPDAIGGRADLRYNRIGSERDETENAKSMPPGKSLPDQLRWKRSRDDSRRGRIGQETVPKPFSGGGVGRSRSSGGRSRCRSAGPPSGAD